MDDVINGLPPSGAPTPNDIEVDAIRRLYHNGYSLAEIARARGVTRQDISVRIKRYEKRFSLPSVTGLYGKRPDKIYRGSDNHNAKLDENDIPRIRQLIANGMSKLEVAYLFDISAAAVGHICSGRTWTHMPPCEFGRPQQNCQKG